MIPFSQQIRIVHSIVLSSTNNKIIYAPVTNTFIKKARIFLKENKYITTPLVDFRFIVLMVVYEHQQGTLDTLKTLQNLSKEDLRRIDLVKESFIMYQNTIDACIQDKSSKTDKTPTNQDHMFYWFWYYQKHQPKNRLAKRKLQNISLVLEYFPRIKDYLRTL